MGRRAGLSARLRLRNVGPNRRPNDNELVSLVLSPQGSTPRGPQSEYNVFSAVLPTIVAFERHRLNGVAWALSAPTKAGTVMPVRRRENGVSRYGGFFCGFLCSYASIDRDG